MNYNFSNIPIEIIEQLISFLFKTGKLTIGLFKEILDLYREGENILSEINLSATLLSHSKAIFYYYFFLKLFLVFIRYR